MLNSFTLITVELMEYYKFLAKSVLAFREYFCSLVSQKEFTFPKLRSRTFSHIAEMSAFIFNDVLNLFFPLILILIM